MANKRAHANKADILAGQITAAMTFSEKVWALTARVPAGQVTTYGRIAKALGDPRASQAVGIALNRNPYAPYVPCHRVVGATGALTGFYHGVDAKRAMLKDEGACFVGDRVDLSDCFEFDPTIKLSQQNLFSINLR